ncbi:hypothetical protein PISMIDRAFT_480452 [Pisolithus microcarpus 441]|uniref:Uncharacterized protein n=1 Tax=Pisolithus microcarpus 441 TaxID=765257 RepID=A0A0C9YWE6_9AGAM|nr:hypothetical protein PISMIDRAFT_480452 [Pisolithus microcarpus 441]
MIDVILWLGSCGVLNPRHVSSYPVCQPFVSQPLTALRGMFTAVFRAKQLHTVRT